MDGVSKALCCENKCGTQMPTHHRKAIRQRSRRNVLVECSVVYRRWLPAAPLSPHDRTKTRQDRPRAASCQTLSNGSPSGHSANFRHHKCETLRVNRVGPKIGGTMLHCAPAPLEMRPSGTCNEGTRCTWQRFSLSARTRCRSMGTIAQGPMRSSVVPRPSPLPWALLGTRI